MSDRNSLHQVHEQVLAALLVAEAACLDNQNGQVDYFGELAHALPHVIALAEERDWIRPEDGDVRLITDGLRLILRRGLLDEEVAQ